MIQAWLLTVLVLFPLWSSAAPSRHAPPAVSNGATILRITPLRGRAHQEVAVYRAGNTTYLSLIQTTQPNRVVWNRSILGQFSQLILPGPPGLFVAISDRGPGSAVYAFVAANGGVRSAFASVPGGRVYGDEGATTRKDGFEIVGRDEEHQGSVQYRFVTEYDLRGGQYVQTAHYRVPDYAPTGYPSPNVVFHTQDGNTILLRLEVAATAAEQEHGLMDRPSLDRDSGMVFVWTSPVHESFWMENTLIPLTVAFIGPDNRIQEMQDMQAETCALHTPSQPYQYAIEANLGFFAANDIKVGDTVTFHLVGSSTATPTPTPTATTAPPPNVSCTTAMQRDGNVKAASWMANQMGLSSPSKDARYADVVSSGCQTPMNPLVFRESRSRILLRPDS